MNKIKQDSKIIQKAQQVKRQNKFRTNKKYIKCSSSKWERRARIDPWDFQHALSKNMMGLKNMSVKKCTITLERWYRSWKCRIKWKHWWEFKRINTLAQKANISNQGNS